MEILGRKRARLACMPCRERKRKCDGREPCTTCMKGEYECCYDTRRRSTRATGQASSNPRPRSESLTSNGVASFPAETEHGGLSQRLEANSGAAFVRKLGLKMDPTKAPRVNLFGWNIGARQLSSQLDTISAIPIIEITSLEHMRSLAEVYFAKVDPCYGFIDQHQFFERLDIRWKSPLIPGVYDSVLGGVTALGCLFSQRTATITELHLMRSARSTLDKHHLCGPPSIDVLTGWTLQTVYHRLTDSPHSTWLASSTLMHLVEASGLHPESSSVLPPIEQCDPDLKRRLVGVAHHLNVWTSFDLGLSRVSFQNNELPLLPSPKPNDYTVEVLGLLPVSVSLEPNSAHETDLAAKLSKTLERSHTQPPSVMAQCNLVLCILRRIHTQHLDLPSSLIEQVLALLKTGLACARSMVMDCSPWHQVVNVSFQIICVLLVMDTRLSLSMLPDAMQTLGLVTSTYPTETTREAYNAACLLVALHQQRRKDDIQVLDETLDAYCQGSQGPSPFQTDFSTEDYSWLGTLVTDFPSLQQVDFDQFLNADMIYSSSRLAA